MQKLLFSLLILINFLAVDSSAQKIIPPKMESLLIFPALSEIKIIRKGNKMQTDTVLSDKARAEITKQVKSIVPDSIKTTPFKSDSQLEEIYKSFAELIILAEAKAKFKSQLIKAPDLLLRILDSAKQDYGLGIVNLGFIRTDENQSKEYTKSMGLNFFTLGTYAFVPNKSFSTLVCFIVDRKQKKLLFYQKSMWRERDPTETIVIKSQLHHLLMSYFQMAG